MKKEAIVIGAGLAGLSAGVELAVRGFKVTVLEKRAILGGRASSFVDSLTGDVIDNGPHLFMGCFQHTLAFLDKIGCLSKLKFQEDLKIDFLDRTGRISSLVCPPFPAPLHLLLGILGMRHIPFWERLKMLRVGKEFFLSKRLDASSLDRITVKDWLGRLRQSDQARALFWNAISLATLNERPEIASARYFAQVLSQSFGQKRKYSTLGLSRVGLSELYGKGARSLIEANGGQVLTRAYVAHLDFCNSEVEEVMLRDGRKLKAGYYVSAVPPHSLKEILPRDILGGHPPFRILEFFTYSPIVSVNLWFDRVITDRELLALLGSRFHWLFNRNLIFSHCNEEGSYISLVISAAREELKLTNQELLEVAIKEVEDFLPEARGARLVHGMAFRERWATISPVRGLSRPNQSTPWRNFFLAGDWTDTGFPATMESAVLSGQLCAQAILAAWGQARTIRK